jgi:hypothetical protein
MMQPAQAGVVVDPVAAEYYRKTGSTIFSPLKQHSTFFEGEMINGTV